MRVVPPSFALAFRLDASTTSRSVVRLRLNFEAHELGIFLLLLRPKSFHHLPAGDTELKRGAANMKRWIGD